MSYKLHSLITFRGRLGLSANRLETWSIGLRIADPIAPTAGLSSQARLDTIADSFDELFANGAMHMTDAVTFEEARMYDIGTDNRATTAPFLNVREATVGPDSAHQHPFQCSLVVTHVGAGLGPGRRGRVFLPPQSLVVDQGGLIPDGNADSIGFLWAEWLTNLNIALAGDAVAVISSGTGAGVLRPIVEVRVGHVLDTHRSRRRSLPETALDSSFAVS